LLRSSLPPAPEGDATAIVRAPHSDDHLSEETIIEPRTGDAVPAKGISSRALVMGMLGAAVLAAGVAVGAVMLTNQPKDTPKEPRFLLVERPGANPNPATTTEPSPSPQTGPKSNPDPSPSKDTEPQSPSPSSAGTTVKTAPTSGGVGALTAAFAKRQGAIQRCFTKNADALQGSPRVSIRFQIAPSGRVTSASVQPSAIAGTALGGCLTSVAKGTAFPPQDKAVAFSIPITAQTVSN
jgi:hypothetical protein